MDSDAFKASGNSPTPWLTAKEAAQYLKVEPRTLLMWARQGTIKGYVLSGTQRITWRFLQPDLDAMLKVPASGKIPAPSVALRTRRVH